jgi:hypothetical protein
MAMGLIVMATDLGLLKAALEGGRAGGRRESRWQEAHGVSVAGSTWSGCSK